MCEHALMCGWIGKHTRLCLSIDVCEVRVCVASVDDLQCFSGLEEEGVRMVAGQVVALGCGRQPMGRVGIEGEGNFVFLLQLDLEEGRYGAAVVGGGRHNRQWARPTEGR